MSDGLDTYPWDKPGMRLLYLPYRRWASPRRVWTVPAWQELSDKTESGALVYQPLVRRVRSYHASRF
jgi:hypothetical protein